MTTPHVVRSTPTPLTVMNMRQLQAAQTLKVLHDNARQTLNALFENAHKHAFQFLKDKISVALHEVNVQDIYCLDQQDAMTVTSAPEERNLKALFEVIYLFGRLAEHELTASSFYLKKNGHLERISEPGQSAIRRALFELQGIIYYHNMIDAFWNGPHAHVPYTNKAYMAQLLEAQLHCANVLRITDGSFKLISGALICRLAYPGSLSDAYLYRLSFENDSRGVHIPLCGAFLISRYPKEHIGSENNCVLYVPDNAMQQFTSLAVMKVHLAAESQAHALDGLAASLSQQDRRQLKSLGNQVLNENDVRLTPVPFSQDFYEKQVQQLIEKQKEDFTDFWSRTTTLPPPDWKFHFLKQGIDARPFVFFGACLQTRALPLIKRWEEDQAAIEKEDEKRGEQPSPLSPIKLTVFMHEDLKNENPASLYNDYFSWLKTELQNLTSRSVNIHLITADMVPELSQFAYRQGSGANALDRWKARVIEYLKKTSQPYSALDKFLLFTQHNFGFSASNYKYGIAELRGHFAIASATKYDTAAHEVGHMLGAIHEDGEVIYNGWWHESLMRPLDEWSFLRGNAYRFSEKNRENIKNYLKTLP
ncbi:hypothetical protein DYL61_14460 [Pseudomonas nabeulensis]|uniref:Uncharacterized protein n=1 Tax=Pseudomonas nabeulensis TaxID=2293833 RepID=A0A4Z0B2K0_9PSED|nr:hypothetical protein [Pseudomonas nabeulensis]TFY93312.1 hypothetical protein DYL61_14460 [Pseudomonas nabeulensis]